MAPTVHCIRHGQGLHNLHSDYTLPDPGLTPLGEEQCASVQSTHFPPSEQREISLVAASPLKRTLHTAWLVFQPLLTHLHFPQPISQVGENQMRILALPDAQETSSDLCDVGTDLPILSSFLASQFPPWPVDLSLLTKNPAWNDKSYHTRFSPHDDAIKARARATRIFLRSIISEIIAKEGRDDVQVALVSHGGFLHYLSEDWEGAASRPGTGFANCEVRSYQFASTVTNDLTNDPDANIVETTSSRQARGLFHPVPGPSEQKRLFVEAMELWEAQGLERPDRLEHAASTCASDSASSLSRQAEIAKTETEREMYVQAETHRERQRAEELSNR